MFNNTFRFHKSMASRYFVPHITGWLAAAAFAMSPCVSAADFGFGSVFVGTLSPEGDDNQILKVLPDGTTTTFAENISGGVRALEFDAAHDWLYALIVREGSVSSRQVLRFSPDGVSELYADLALIPAAAGSGDTDIEVDANNRVFVTTATHRVIELFGGANAALRYEGPLHSVYHALEISKSGEIYLGDRGGDVIRLDASFANPTTFAHVQLSDADIDFQAIDTDSFGNLVVLVQDFSTNANIYRIDAMGSVEPFAQTDNQAGKLAVGLHNDVLAVDLHRVDVFNPHGILVDTLLGSRQLDGIAVVVPEPHSIVGISLLASYLIVRSPRRLRRWTK